jgi:hypothetical protein
MYLCPCKECIQRMCVARSRELSARNWDANWIHHPYTQPFSQSYTAQFGQFGQINPWVNQTRSTVGQHAPGSHFSANAVTLPTNAPVNQAQPSYTCLVQPPSIAPDALGIRRVTMEPRVNNLLLPQPLNSPDRLNPSVALAPYSSSPPEQSTPSDYANLPDADRSDSTFRTAFKPQPTTVPHLKGPPIRPAKSAVPLAEVLNSNSPKTTPVDRLAASQDGEPKKRRKLDGEQLRTLPKPSTGSKRRQGRLLPPVLAPLHNPPAQTRIFPSVNPDGLMPSISDLSPPLSSIVQDDTGDTRERLVGQNADPTPAPGADVQDKANDKDGESDPSQSLWKGPRRMWTEAETQFLIQGVERFGIGSWKKILNHPEYEFQSGRNAVDLKDRFRTCFPAVYRDRAHQQEEEEIFEGTSPDSRAKGAPMTVELSRMGATEPVNMTFPKLDRRRRKNFTKDEDEALLGGFIKYGSQWKRIQMDPMLGLQHRTRTDLRDRFRNRYPQRFMEAGYKHKAKQQHPPVLADRTDETVNPWAPLDELVSNRVINLGSTLEPAPSSSNDGSHTMRLLTAGFDAFGDNFSEEPDDDSGIQLSRTIIDWADQNSRQLQGGQSVDVASVRFAAVSVPLEIPSGPEGFPSQPALSGNPSTAPLSLILNSRGSARGQPQS